MVFEKLSLRALAFLEQRGYLNRVFLRYEQELERRQEAAFSKLGFNRSKALDKLNQTLQNIYAKNYTEKNGMWSEHLILFAAISASDYKINKILEIGTFNGETTRILSALFPSSEIRTIDLPFSQILETKMYTYETEDNQLLAKRSTNLKLLSNVDFFETNSLSLINSLDSYDLIWVDGDHSYPTAAIDIANGVRMLNKGGLAICDDVYIKASSTQHDGRSRASIETLTKLKDAGLIELELLNKRLGGYFNFPKVNLKYLGIIFKK